MALVATQTQYVEDEFGVRRLIVEGAPLPPGIDTSNIETREADLRAAAAPIVDTEASKPRADATKGGGGTSLEASEGLRQSARGRGKSGARKAGGEE